jgi:hypothetical protein
MPPIEEGKLRFTFPAGWSASAYDKWPYYQNQFQPSCGGNKAVDILARDPDQQLWLVEVKDYREYPRTKPIDLWDEVAIKVRDTLAGLVCAKVETAHANPGADTAALGARKLRVILHLEQPAKHSKLFPRIFDTEKVRQKLRTLVKPIDPHPRVVELGNLAGVPWTVVSI